MRRSSPPPSLDSANGTVSCPSCGAAVRARYCPECGERRVREGELSLRRLIADATRELLGADSRVWRSFRTLLLRPGALTAEYVAGRRRPYLKPIQVFLIANLVYFFVQPLTIYTGYNSTLESQVERQYYSEPLQLGEVVSARVAEAEIAPHTYERLYNLQSGNYAKTLVILMVPMLALVLALLLAFRRRPLAQHLVFALHFYAWDLLFMSSLFMLVWGWTLRGVRVAFPELGQAMMAGSDIARFSWFVLTEMPTAPFTIAYLYLAARRFYDLARPAAALLAVALLPLLFLVTLAYRLVLFWLTFLTV